MFGGKFAYGTISLVSNFTIGLLIKLDFKQIPLGGFFGTLDMLFYEKSFKMIPNFLLYHFFQVTSFIYQIIKLLFS